MTSDTPSMRPITGADIITISEIAAHLHMSRQSARDLCRRPDFPRPLRVVGPRGTAVYLLPEVRRSCRRRGYVWFDTPA